MNPWLGIAVLVAFGLAAFGGYQHGYEKAVGDAAVKTQAAGERVVAEHNAGATVDARAVERAAAARWGKRLKDMEARHALELDLVRRKPLPECRAACDLDPDSLDLLRRRVREANDPAQALGSGLRAGGVPAPSGAPGRGLGDDQAVSR